ncbi:MAG: TonB-dependent receptor plug domain-containing protein [Thermoanaerobaculia bacterium]
MLRLSVVTLLISSLSLCVSPHQALAQEPPEKKPEQATPKSPDTATPTETKAIPSFFDETTVTATGSARDVFDVATPVTVIRADEIQRKSPENAADLLREQPGVDITGVGPNQTRPVIRGQRGLRVLFLENGLRINNPRRQTDFGEITGLVDVESVSTIEVVRGPASVLYGSDAIGGVLNLISAEPAFAPGSEVSGFAALHYGDAGSLRSGSAGVNTSLGRVVLQLGGTKRQGDDYSVPSGRFGGISLDHRVAVNDTGIDDSTIWGSAKLTLNDRDTFRFRFNHYRSGETGFGFIPPHEYNAPEDLQMRIFYPDQSFNRFTLSYFASPLKQAFADSTNVQVYFQRNKRKLANDILIDIGPVGPGFPDSSVQANTLNFTDLQTWGVRADAVKALWGGRHIVTYGYEGYRDDSFNTDFSRTVTTIRIPGNEFPSTSTDSIANAPNATNTSNGVFAQDEWTASSRLRLTGGLRFHRVTTKAEATPGLNVNGLDFSDHNVVGALTATYQVTEAMNLLASFGRGFRAPNIIERLFNGATPEGDGFQILNGNLKSETSANWDLGWKYRRSDAFMELVAFRNDIREGIIQAFLSPEEIAALPAETQAAIKASGAQFVVQQRNADRLRYQGVEMALGWRTRQGLVIGGNYTYINGVRPGSNILPPGDNYSNKTFAYLRYEPESRYWAEYHVRHNGNQKVHLDPNEPPPVVGTTLPAFTIHGVGAGARVFQTASTRHDVSVWLENATNELYAEFSNATFFRPEPGRTFKVSYRIGF